jgi:hypothetical protein
MNLKANTGAQLHLSSKEAVLISCLANQLSVVLCAAEQQKLY